MGRINEVLHSDHQDDEPFLWPELFLFRGVGDLIRGRPAAGLSLAERLAHPCCLIGTAVLLTRASYGTGNRLLAPYAAVTAGSLPLVPTRKVAELAQGST